MSGMSGSHAVSQESEHVLFAVRGSCDMCKERIETAAKGVPVSGPLIGTGRNK